MDVYEYITELRRRGVFSIKQTMVIEGVNIYVNNGVVYKVIIHVDPRVLKKAKKLGLNNEYIIYEMNDRLKLEDKYSKGRVIIIYDTRKNTADVYEGENSEQEQVSKLKRK